MSSAGTRQMSTTSEGRAVNVYRQGANVMAMLAMCMLSSGAGASEDDVVEPKIPVTSEAAFDIAFGIAATTDYVSRGITNSDSSPAIQGYIEPSYDIAYVNIWSSNVDYGKGFRGAEIDVAVGARPEIGPVSLDIGYVHYFYSPEDVSPDYGEIFVKANYNVQDMFTVVTRVFFAPDFNQSGKTATFVAGGVKVPLPHDFSVYGGVGYQFFEDPDAFEQLTWTAGLSYSWKAMTFDVRYWDTDLSGDECTARSGFSDGCDARVVGTLSLDTTWSALKDLSR